LLFFRPFAGAPSVAFGASFAFIADRPVTTPDERGENQCESIGAWKSHESSITSGQWLRQL